MALPSVKSRRRQAYRWASFIPTTTQKKTSSSWIHQLVKMEIIRQKELIPLMETMDPDSLKKLAKAIGRIVSENLDYWRLMYIDVVEFRHKHFIHSFREIAGGLRTYANAVIRESKVAFPSGVDPSLAYTAIYLQFFTYFLAEELFGAKRHLG